LIFKKYVVNNFKSKLKLCRHNSGPIEVNKYFSYKFSSRDHNL
jgi:hypothetical protein